MKMALAEKLFSIVARAGFSILAAIWIGRYAGSRDAGWAAFCIFSLIDTWVERLRERA